jgi:hypothetical protein
MEITITVDGITRRYRGDYDTLYNNDWEEKVRDLLDVVKDNQ